MVDLVCALLILLFGYLGWRRGFFMTVLPLVGLAAGYLAAYLLYRPAGEVVGALFGLQPLLAYPIGGGVVLVLTMLLFSLVGLLLRKRRAGRRPRKIVNRLGGALVGGAYATGLALLVAWCLLSLQALRPESSFGPRIHGTLIGRLATPMAEEVARRLAGGQTGDGAVGQTAASFARDPLRSSRDLSDVLSDRRVQKALQDRRLMRRLARDPQSAARSPRLRSLAKDADFVGKLQRLGLVQSAEAGDLPPEEIVRQLTKRLRPTARLVQELAEDSEVQALLNDAQLSRRMEQRDIATLANDPKFNRLLEIITTRMRAINAEEKANRSPPTQSS